MKVKAAALKRISNGTVDLPERWREVLESALLNADFATEAELIFQSALAVHKNYPSNMEPAEAILAGDAFIPMAIESMLDSNCSLEELEQFLKNAVCFFDR
ncbi:MAG: hypothetical protein KAS73_02590 [Candidatus Sabulitectum sp.]|nr:hypothetical protein [Candidatus Sabulitectum sp.]